MVHRIVILLLTFFMLPACAQVRAVGSIGYGLDYVDFNYSNHVLLIPPFYNTYEGEGFDENLVGSLFLGIEAPFYEGVIGQLGVSYYQSLPFNPQGVIYQFGNPAFQDVGYDFKLINRRVLLESKILATIQKTIHPYCVAAVGAAFNHAYDYDEFLINTTGVAMPYTYGNHNQSSFAYTLGLGLDFDVNDHIRVGGGYRISDMGKASLGTIPVQQSTDTITYDHIIANELLAQFTYLF